MWRRSSYSQQNGHCVEVDQVEWITSSHSRANGDCVQAAGAWITSSYSAMNGNCVQAAKGFRKAAVSLDAGCVEAAPCGCTERVTIIRDSKDKAGPCLAFTPAAFGGLLARIKVGELDLV